MRASVLFFNCLLLLTVTGMSSCAANPGTAKTGPSLAATGIITGAEQTELYFPLLRGKRIALLANPTTVIGKTHLVDSLLRAGIKVAKIFGPEHGFRGNAGAGDKVKDETDPQTGIPLLSLYGSKRKPSAADMADVDLFVFDIQDVGCRFYTYINVLRDVMESCAENKKPLLILDRPNPNGYLVDGPILDMSLKSGIGQFPIPIAHGMTVGEFAKMINGEGWLPGGLTCELQIIPVKNYRHDMPYTLPVPPSPNLNTQQSILLYPSLCLFEGTIVSQGRGTDSSFAILGAPLLKGKYDFHFRPRSIPGKSESPLHLGADCYGLNLLNYDVEQLRRSGKVNIRWMMELYKAYPDNSKFFDRSQSKQMGDIDKLAGTRAFRQQIEQGLDEAAIRASWEPGLSAYKTMRKKYLLYP